jgi:hypothetical protein
VKETSLKKPAKTREELESAIRTEMEDICEWPTGLAISVVPHEDSWKVVIMTEGPQDAERCDICTSVNPSDCREVPIAHCLRRHCATTDLRCVERRGRCVFSACGVTVPMARGR